MHNIYYENNLLKGDFFSDNLFYIVFPYGTGDTWYTASYVHAYIEHHLIEKTVCYITKSTHADIVNWFIRPEDLIYISDTLVEELNSFSINNGIWHLDNYLYAHFKKYKNQVLYPEYYEDSGNMIEKYRRLVFNLPDDTEMAPPLFPAVSEDLFKRYQIDKKTIILMPYAKSMYPLPMIFWEALTRLLTKHGYRVFTNTGPGETPINGTDVMAESISNTILLCREALAVISLRSGICDILATTPVLLFVIYTIEHYYHYWNLSCMRKDGSIANLPCFDTNNSGSIAKAIAECLLCNDSEQNNKTIPSSNPLISIIMPVRNNENIFPAAVQSILDQEFENWELIIMEGLSTDNTAVIADNLALSDPRISVVHIGEWIYESINAGINIAKGKYFTVVNSDDKLAPEALSIIPAYLLKYDIDMFMIASGSIICDKNQNEISNNFASIESILPDELVILDSNELKANWVRILSSGLLNNQINVYKIDRIRNIRFRNDVFGADYLYNLDVLPYIRSVAYVPKCLYHFHIYSDTKGFNTSVGKFYDYTHSMFNDFYYKGLNMFVNNNRLDKEALLYLKKRRYMEFVSSELVMYKFKTCLLSLDNILLHILSDAADIKNLIKDESITTDLDDNVLSACNELLEIHANEETKIMLSVASGIRELFSIGNSDLSNINTDLINRMVYDYHNPANIGKQLYNDILTAINTLN